MRGHFRSRHLEDIIMITEEGLFPRCIKCGLFQMGANDADKHQATKTCKKWADKMERYFQQQRQNVVQEETHFYVRGRELERVTEFKYLGRMMQDNDDDDAAYRRQLQRARQKWARFGQVLRKQEATPKVMGYFYKAVIQAVLLYGAETWARDQLRLRQFRSFHHRMARFITGAHSAD